MSTRTILACLLVASLFAASAHAQGMPSTDPGTGAAGAAAGAGGGKHRGGGGKQQAQKAAPVADEKAYRSAIESLPDQKYDPWRNMR